jgi:hypothetical protein
MYCIRAGHVADEQAARVGVNKRRIRATCPARPSQPFRAARLLGSRRTRSTPFPRSKVPSPPFNLANPRGNMLTHAFGELGLATYLVLGERREVYLLRVEWP